MGKSRNPVFGVSEANGLRMFLFEPSLPLKEHYVGNDRQRSCLTIENN
jgi:hypothetical protein